MKCLGPIRGVLLSMLGGFGTGLILCCLQGQIPTGALVMAAVGAMGSLAGALSTGRKLQTAAVLSALGLLGSAGLSIGWFGGYLLPLLHVGLYLLTMGALTVSGYGFYGPLGVWSTILSGLSVLFSHHFGGIWPAASGTAALVCLVLTLDGFRDSSMRKSQHKKREHKHISNPSRILQHSYLLTGIFLLGAMAVGLLTYGLSSGLIKAIRLLFAGGAAGAGNLFGWIFRAIEAVIQWFSDLFPDLADTGGSTIDGSSNSKPIYTGGPGSLLATIIMIVCFVLACLAMSLVIGRLLLKNRTKPKISEEVCDYEEEIESLARPKLRFPWNKGRRQRYRNVEDPTLKIRYAFQQLMCHKQKDDGQVFVKTPNELLDPSIPDEKSLIQAYNRVKYAQGGVTEAELEAAARYLKHL